MGIYFNPGNTLFQRTLNSEIYVDKTMLIQITNRLLDSKNNLICVSRPRRFGKSMALEMLSAYYSRGCDSRELFSTLKIGQIADEDTATEQEKRDCFEKGLNRYDVLWIDMQGTIACALENARTQQELSEFYKKEKQCSPAELETMEHPMLLAVQREIIRDLREDEICGAYIAEEEQSLGNALFAIYKNTGRTFVLLIDEWDCIFRNYVNDRFLQDKYINWLRDMFKNSVRLPMYALVYMTGILPIRRCGTQSALNNFMEYTFLNPLKLAEFSGFTEGEVKALCQKYDFDFEKMSAYINERAGIARTGEIHGGSLIKRKRQRS